MKINPLFAWVFAFLALASCRDNNAEDDVEIVDEVSVEDDSATLDTSVFTVVDTNPELSYFSKSIESANLERAFRGKAGNFTIFAPSDDAYDALGKEKKDSLFDMDDVAMRGAMIYYLAVNEKISLDELRERIKKADGVYTMPTMQGEVITATIHGDSIILADNLGNFASIQDSAMIADNGVVYTIDEVLQPMDARKNAAVQDSVKNPSEMDKQQ